MHQNDRLQNIDWVKFDEFYEEAKQEIFLQTSAKKSVGKKVKTRNYWHSSLFYLLYKKVYAMKKLIQVLNFTAFKSVLSLKY